MVATKLHPCSIKASRSLLTLLISSFIVFPCPLATNKMGAAN